MRSQVVAAMRIVMVRAGGISNQPELKAFLYRNSDEIAGTIVGLDRLAQFWHNE